MTKEEAQITLANLKRYMSGGGVVDGKANEAIDMAIEALEESERKKGRWLWLSSTYDRVPCEMRFACSECDHVVITHDSDPWELFCPNCGADMRSRKLQYGDNDTLQGGLMSAT